MGVLFDFNFMSCLTSLLFCTANFPVFHIDLNELQVREGSFITTVSICILMTSGGPLQEDIYFTVGAQNGSAIGWIKLYRHKT